MTNKKIDTYLKFTFYFLPVVFMLVEFWLCARQSGNIQSVNQLFSMINGALSWTSDGIFSSFTTWIHTNLASSNNCLDFLLYYSYYVCIVEFVLLLKNVLIFIFKVAENWLHKGVNLCD